MDRLMELSEYMVKRIKDQPDKFYLIMEPEMVNVSFWYIPTRLRKMPHSAAREQELGKVTKTKERNNHKMSLADVSHHEIENDAIWYPHGGIPARRQKTKLLQKHHLVCSCHRKRYRFPLGRDGPAWA
jgi:hypothetical protein